MGTGAGVVEGHARQQVVPTLDVAGACGVAGPRPAPAALQPPDVVAELHVDAADAHSARLGARLVLDPHLSMNCTNKQQQQRN